MRQKNKSRKWVIMLSILCILLFGALATTVYRFETYKQKDVLSATKQVQLQQAYEDGDAIAMETFKQYADQYGVSTEFLQRFFDDAVVYRDTGGIVYAPIDEDLPKNSYDFNNLVDVNGILEYQEDGVSKGIKGIDVSKHQGDIDWEKVKADGVEYAIIRLGYRGYATGKMLVDENYENNINGALDAGLKVGVYFYSQAISVEEAKEEADLVLENIKDYDITYPVVFDMEEIIDNNVRTSELTTEQRTDITIAFCDKIEKAGYKPVIYANVKWFLAKLDMHKLIKYDKWFAQYRDLPFFPYDFDMWQYGLGKVDGIKGNADLNISFKDYAAEAKEDNKDNKSEKDKENSDENKDNKDNSDNGESKNSKNSENKTQETKEDN